MKDVVQFVGVVFLIRCSSALPSEPEKHEDSVLKWVQINAWMLWRKKKELFRGVFQRVGSRHSSSPTAPPKALQFGPSSAHAPGTADGKRGQVKAGFITLTLSGNAPLTSPGPQAPRHLSWVVWISSQQWPHLAYPPPGGPGMDSGELKVMAEGFRQTHSLFSVQSSQMESAPSTIWIQNGAGRSAQNAGCNLEHSSKGTVPSENSHSHRNGQYFQKTSAVMWPRQQEAECSPPPQAFSKQTRVCFYLRPPYTVEKMQNELCTKREAWQ